MNKHEYLQLGIIILFLLLLLLLNFRNSNHISWLHPEKPNWLRNW